VVSTLEKLSYEIELRKEVDSKKLTGPLGVNIARRLPPQFIKI
jgi:hypothetical protein